MIKNLLIPERRRSEQEIEALVRASSFIDFFAKMGESRLYKEKKIQESCCRKMYQIYGGKGHTMIKFGKGNL
jgi:hypothetical protein